MHHAESQRSPYVCSSGCNLYRLPQSTGKEARTTFSRRSVTSSSALWSLARSVFTCSLIELHCGGRRGSGTSRSFVVLLEEAQKKLSETSGGQVLCRNDEQRATLRGATDYIESESRHSGEASLQGPGSLMGDDRPGPGVPRSGAPWLQHSQPPPARASREPPCALAQAAPSV